MDVRDTRALQILKDLENKEIRIYLNFLGEILPKVNYYNRLFQSEGPRIHEMYEGLTDLVRMVMQRFIQVDSTTPIDEIDINNLSIQLNVMMVNIGNLAEPLAQQQSQVVQQQIRMNCRNF